MFCSCLIEDMEGLPINQGAGLRCSTNIALIKIYYKPPQYT